MTQFEQKVKDISLGLGMANLNDLATVGNLLSMSEELAKSEEGKKNKKAVKALTDALEAFVMGDYKNKKDGIAKISEAIANLESITDGEPQSANAAKGQGDLKELREYAASSIGLIEDLENDLISLEKKYSDKELLNSIFRAVHTLKGETGFAGLPGISELLHHYEGIFSLLREKPVKLKSADTDLLLSIVDIVKKTFELCAASPEAATTRRFTRENETLEELKNSIASLKATPNQAETKIAELKTKPEVLNLAEIEDVSIYKDFITESRDHLENIEAKVLELETNPSEYVILDDIFRPLHTIKGVSGFLALTHINHIAHDSETLLDHARNNRLVMDRECIDLVFEILDVLRKLLTHVEMQLAGKSVDGFQYPPVEAFIFKITETTQNKLAGDAAGASVTVKPEKKLGQILLEEKLVSQEDLYKALEKQEEEGGERKLGEILLEDDKVTAKEVSEALRKQIDQSSLKQDSGAVKVSIDKLDNMIDMVGELVISQTLIAQHALITTGRDPVLSKNVSHLSKIVRDIQFVAMSLRMVPIKATFQKMGRLVRDLAVKSGKKVELAITGGETELDKNVVEQINDPLVHMIRNSVDHGIEQPSDRIAKGKTETGHVSLNAYHQGGNIIIEVVDDGKGLDCNAIRKKGIERKLIKEDTVISDHELFQLIFEPGFSTAEKITDVSGRGVGMDVVRKNIEKLGGMVSISSEKGKGSKFTIRLPLTMAILDGMILQSGEERYLMPIIAIKESIQPAKKDVATIQGRGEVINVRGNLIQLIRLHDIFNENARKAHPWEAIVMIVEHAGKSYGIMVDEILGQQQVVIKSLKGEFRQTKGISGASILGDGRVGLILDVKGLVDLAVEKAGDMEQEMEPLNNRRSDGTN
ncbi:MAG: chemotaxis protein CheA [Fibrobacteres bacterium]|nr:chemotaxis protein CheA [Fibrobacterota bacterium]